MKYSFWLLILICIVDSVSSQETFHRENFAVEQVSLDKGLSQCVVTCIHEDRNGFIWLGTKDGLNRYDGKSIVTFTHEHKDSSSISNSYISCIAEDASGKLYVGTRGGGLNVFDPATEVFSDIDLKSERSGFENIKVITDLALVEDHYLLIGTQGIGLYVMDLETGETKNYYRDKDDPSSMPADLVRDILYNAKNGDIFLSIDHEGLYKFDLYKETFTLIIKSIRNYPYEKKKTYNSMSLEGDKLWLNNINHALESYDLKTGELRQYRDEHFKTSYITDILVRDSMIWIATQGYGMLVFDPARETFRKLETQTRNLVKFPVAVTFLYEDGNQNLWLGSNGEGAFLLTDKTKNFITYNNYSESESNKDHPSIRGILKQGDSLWITTYDGVRLYDLKNDSMFTIAPYRDVFVVKPAPLFPGYLWMGDEGGGVQKFNKSTFEFKDMPNEDIFLEDHIYGVSIYSLLNDGKYLWVGSQNGLNRYNKLTGEVKHYIHDDDDPQSINYGRIITIYKDSRGRMWVGTDVGGAGMFYPDSTGFTHFSSNPEIPGSLSNNYVNAINEDSQGNIWICTHGGLNMYRESNNDFRLFTKSDGLPNNVIYCALEDNEGNLWISTNKGISKFNPGKNTYVNYDKKDGLQNDEFNMGAYYKADDGLMIFGGITGFTMFYPEQINHNTQVPEIAYTYLIKKDQPGEHKIPITGVNEIGLGHRETIFDVEFASLNFYQPQKNQYKYRLSGIGNKTTGWIDLKNRNSISFFGLEPGEYKLQVIGSNNDGVWNSKGKLLQIIIRPPFWKTDLFRISLLLLIIALGTAAFLVRIRIIRRQRDKMKKLVEERTSELRESNNSLMREIAERKKVEEQLLEANQAKDKLFSIIGHDLKSPLSTLLSLSRYMQQEYDDMDEEERKSFVGYMQESAENVFSLTDNILNWARTQTGRMTVNPRKTEIRSAIDNNIRLFKSESDKKDITLENRAEHVHAYVDQNMLAAILRNLTSNAIKFTSRGGNVWFYSRRTNDTIVVRVKDNGTGMDRETKDTLFKPAHANKAFGTENEPGTGLGLLICKEFVDINGGRISVSSTAGKGTTISFTLPAAD